MIVHIVLYSHIAAGFVALVAGLIAMIARKGRRLHRNAGKTYFWSMAWVAGTAFVLAPVYHNVFLFLIAVLAFYSALTGYRALARKNPFTTPPTMWDWAAASVLAAAGAGMLVLAITRSTLVVASFLPMLVVFGAISLFLSLSEMRSLYRPPVLKGAWLLKHIGNMIGAYIATMTAFSATNFSFLPLAVRWLWPTLVLVPVIIVSTRKYATQMPATYRPEPAV